MIPPDHDDAALEQAMIVRLGMAMTVAGESIDEVGDRLHAIARSRGVDDLSVVVLPTALFVQTGDAATVRVQLDAFSNRQVRLDQIGDLYDLLKRAEHPDTDPADVIDAVGEILRSPPTYGPIVRTLGLGILSIGFALTLQPTGVDVLMAFLLGLLVGVLRLFRVPGLQAVLPVLATFLVATIVFATADDLDSANPMRTLIPPLVTFLPGAILTTGMRDLAAGQVVSGSSRLVQGIVVLLLLAFGVVAAAALVGAPDAHLLDRPVTRFGPWAPWVALVFVALGTHLHHCARRRAVPWILGILVIAYAGQTVAAAVFSPELSPLFGAAVMAPAALWVERLPTGPPSLVTFLPAFWLLVPGAAGLIGVTEMVGTDSVLGPDDFIDALSSVVEVALGVLLGTAVFRAGAAGVDEALRTLPEAMSTRRWPHRRERS